MSLSLISELEDILEEEGCVELLGACKAIVGSDGSDDGIALSVNEDGMKESMGVKKVYWLKYKITILENITIFEEKCQELGLKSEQFIKEINEDVQAVEDFLNKK